MKVLRYQFEGGRPMQGARCLVGVVASGNLEVLIEPDDVARGCDVLINTTVRGFDAVWAAVVDDFFQRHRPAGMRLSINDNGATPAVVSLRLDQAIEEYSASTPGAAR